MVAAKFKDLEIVVRFRRILIYCPMICNGSKGGSNPPSLGSNPSGATIIKQYLNTMELKFKRLEDNAILPIRGTKGAAGIDLTCIKIDTVINEAN